METDKILTKEFEAQRDLCALIGLTLVELQGVEKLLRSCIGLVFQDADGNPLADLRNPKSRRKTMGQFMTILRQKSSIDPTFDEVLSNFLDRRNQFIHDLLGNKLFRLTSPNGRQHVRLFIDRLRSETDLVGKFMMGALMGWIETDKYADISKVRIRFRKGSWLGDAEQIFAPHTTELIRPKPKR